jgi:indole-3-glycerol phosphate synthase
MTQTPSTMRASSTPDLLATIVAAARRIVEVRREGVSDAALEQQAARRSPDGAGFLRALRDGESPRVIAECKRRSPSRGILREDCDAAVVASSYASGGAAAISVLTEPTFFDGSLDDLASVRAAVRVPILRKDFVVSRYQILEAVAAGADAVLLIVGALDPSELRTLIAQASAAGVASLVEAHDADELRLALDSGAAIVGVNSRNLRTLDVEPELHDRLAPLIPPGVVSVAESGLRELADLERLERIGYTAFLVGERLITQPDPGAALRRLRKGTS